MVAGLVAWSLLLAGLAVWSYREDAPTVREQRTLADATPLVSAALGNLVAAAGDGAVSALDPTRVAEGCRITPVRDGAELTGGVRFYAAPEGVPALLGRIAAGLPASFAARASATALRADAGDFVAVRGRQVAPGVVQVVVTTGCRPVGAAVDDLGVGSPVEGLPDPVLTALGASSVESGTLTVAPCPDGGLAATAIAVGRGDALKPLRSAGGVAVLDSPDAYAYRADGFDYVVRPAGDDAVRVAATQPC